MSSMLAQGPLDGIGLESKMSGGPSCRVSWRKAPSPGGPPFETGKDPMSRRTRPGRKDLIATTIVSRVWLKHVGT